MAGRHRKPPSRHHRGRHRQPPSNARWIAPTLATVAVLAAGGLSAYTALHGSDAGTPTASAPTAAATSATASSAAPTAATSPSAKPSPGPTSTADDQPNEVHAQPALRIVVTGRVSWVEVTRGNGHVVFSGLLRHGHRLVYGAGPLHVVVGDAGAVRVDRHGHPHAPLGRPGQVVRFNA